MDPVELRARREALGLGQDALARLLGVQQPTVSRWEVGERAPRDPASIDAVLRQMEDRCDELTERMIVACQAIAEAVLIVHVDDATFWAAHPEHDGLPAVVQRVAAARAVAVVFRKIGVRVPIISA